MNCKNSANRFFNRKTAMISATVGVILLIISYYLSPQKAASDNSYSTYSQYLEARLEEIISHAGCENVSVMITMKDTVKKETDKENESVFSFSKNNETGEQYTSQEIAGVVIVCSSITEKADFNIIKQAASTALDIPKNKIYIFGGAANQ